jgi:hypothetical protein
MDTSTVVALGSFLALQTGALIFFAGRVTQKLDDHDWRIRATEKESRANAIKLAELGRGES